MQINHPPPYDLNQMFQILQQEWQVIPQETDEVGHVHAWTASTSVVVTHASDCVQLYL